MNIHSNIAIFEDFKRWLELKLVTILCEYLFEYKFGIQTLDTNLILDICLYLFSNQTYSNTSSCDFFKTNIFGYIRWDRKSHVCHTLCLRHLKISLMHLTEHFISPFRITKRQECKKRLHLLANFHYFILRSFSLKYTVEHYFNFGLLQNCGIS